MVLVTQCGKLTRGHDDAYFLNQEIHPDHVKCYLLPGANQVHALNENVKNFQKDFRLIFPF